MERVASHIVYIGFVRSEALIINLTPDKMSEQRQLSSTFCADNTQTEKKNVRPTSHLLLALSDQFRISALNTFISISFQPTAQSYFVVLTRANIAVLKTAVPSGSWVIGKLL